MIDIVLMFLVVGACAIATAVDLAALVAAIGWIRGRWR
jgi:hypothetical protein